jgi:DNA invertase Pin-like site-specific DNA recombinase
MISLRTKAALEAARERGVKLGGDRGYRPSLESSKRAAQAKHERAVLRANDFRNALEEVRGSVGGGLRAMAREMNRRGIPTPSSKEDAQWHPATVSRVLAKLEVKK